MRRKASAALLLAAISILVPGGCAGGRADTKGRGLPRVVHVIVVLADNKYQGIVPVPSAIGNGDDPANNLYWGIEYGVRTWFRKSPSWTQVGKCRKGQYPVLERCVFEHKEANVVLVADAWRGREIRQAIGAFFSFAAGQNPETLPVDGRPAVVAGGGADLVAYVGHDGLMDFPPDGYRERADGKRRDVIILACASKRYFADPLRRAGAFPLLWTTNLMAPEAYTLEAALNGWVLKEPGEQIRARAAAAYDKYQHCGANAARKLFATGW